MAYAVMPDIGGDLVCADCDHRDCAYWRRMIGSECVVCGDPVEAGETYVLRGDGDAVAHYDCHLATGEVA